MTELELTEDQIKAVRSLERAFRKCVKSNLFIHNCYGILIAYDGNMVDCVDDDETEIPCNEGHTINISRTLELASWADDAHYVHLRDDG